MEEKEEAKNLNNEDIPPDVQSMPGFDVLPSLREEPKMKSYNEEFYNTLSNLKFLSLSVCKEDKLFYHFEKNDNASITSTTGQIFTTINDIKRENINLHNSINEIQSRIIKIKEEYKNIEHDSGGGILEQIKNIEKKLQIFIVESRTETFKLVKEVANLKKEKNELMNQIQAAIARVEKIEKELGKNKKKIKINMNVNKQNVNNNKTFMETKTFNNTLESNKEAVKTEISI